MGGDVVGRLRRAARIEAQIGVVLRLQHRRGEAAGRLADQDDVRAGRELDAICHDRLDCLLNLDRASAQHIQQLGGGDRVGLAGGDDECVRRAGLDSVALDREEIAHPAVAPDGGGVERGPGGDRVVVDDVAQRPVAASPRQRVVPCRDFRIESPPLGQLGFGEHDRCRDSHAGRLRQDADPAVVVLVGARGGIGVEDDVGRHAGLAGRRQIGSHRLAHQRHLGAEDRVDIRVVGVDERRQHVACAIRHHLVLVEDDVWVPDVMDLLDCQPRLGLGKHEPVAVIIVTRIGMVERRRLGTLVRSAERLLVVVGDQLHPVGIERGNQQQDHLVEDALDLEVVARGEIVDKLRRHLDSADLGCMDRACQQQDGAAFDDE